MESVWSCKHLSLPMLAPPGVTLRVFPLTWLLHKSTCLRVSQLSIPPAPSPPVAVHRQVPPAQVFWTSPANTTTGVRGGGREGIQTNKAANPKYNDDDGVLTLYEYIQGRFSWKIRYVVMHLLGECSKYLCALTRNCGASIKIHYRLLRHRWAGMLNCCERERERKKKRKKKGKKEKQVELVAEGG